MTLNRHDTASHPHGISTHAAMGMSTSAVPETSLTVTDILRAGVSRCAAKRTDAQAKSTWESAQSTWESEGGAGERRTIAGDLGSRS